MKRQGSSITSSDRPNNWRSLLKALIPPILASLVARRRAPPAAAYIWEGIFPNRESVPREGETYDNSARIAEFLDRTQAAVEAVSCGRKPELGWHQPLGLLAATVCSDQRHLTVLDFGGGLGLGFVQLLSSLPSGADIRYHVVELEKMCEAGKQLFEKDCRIHFHTRVPVLDRRIDIVYASSVLPYVDDYAGQLKQFAELKPRYLFLTQLAAGRFPSYAARQLNLPGQVLPYWFLNLEEVIATVSGCGYSLIYEEQTGPEYDQSNYPESHRLGRMRSLLFVWNADGDRQPQRSPGASDISI